MIGIIDVETRTIATVRESETEPPQLFAARGEERTPIGGLYNPFPELDGAADFALAAIENAIRTSTFCSINSKFWLDQNEVTFRKVLKVRPHLEPHFARVWALCH